MAACVTPPSAAGHASRQCPRVVLNVRVSLTRRPPGPIIPRHTVTEALPMSSPATRLNNTSTRDHSLRVDGRWDAVRRVLCQDTDPRTSRR